MRRLATLDVGTNTVLLLVAEVDDDGRVAVLSEGSEITRLGEGMGKSALLGQEPMARTLATIAEFNDEVQAQGASWAGAVATAAARDAKNSGLFLTMARALGVPLEVISGDEEAQLSFYSVLSERPPGSHATLLAMDIGGGSTEFIVGDDDGVRSRLSTALGSVRLTEQRLSRHPVPAPELASLRSTIAEALVEVPVPEGEFTMVGLAGTMTALAAIDQGQREDNLNVQHALLSRERVEALLERLGKLSIAERVSQLHLPERRADVIVAGAAIALEAMRHFDAQALFVSDRGVRWGLLWRALAQALN